jgi:hypothetical protein
MNVRPGEPAHLSGYLTSNLTDTTERLSISLHYSPLTQVTSLARSS